MGAAAVATSKTSFLTLDAEQVLRAIDIQQGNAITTTAVGRAVRVDWTTRTLAELGYTTPTLPQTIDVGNNADTGPVNYATTASVALTALSGGTTASLSEVIAVGNNTISDPVNYATTASVSDLCTSAVYAGTADYAGMADISMYAFTAGTAGWADGATTADYALVAGSAPYVSPDRVYEVSASGRPYTTIQDALAAITDDSTYSMVLVWPGTYDGPTTISKANVILRGMGRGKTRICGDSPNLFGLDHPLSIVANNVTVMDLSVGNLASSVAGIAIAVGNDGTDTDDVRLINVDAFSTQRDTVYVNGCTDFAADNCIIDGDYDIVSLEFTTATITNCQLYTDRSDVFYAYDSDVYGTDIQVYGYPTTIAGTIDSQWFLADVACVESTTCSLYYSLGTVDGMKYHSVTADWASNVGVMALTTLPDGSVHITDDLTVDGTVAAAVVDADSGNFGYSWHDIAEGVESYFGGYYEGAGSNYPVPNVTEILAGTGITVTGPPYGETVTIAATSTASTTPSLPQTISVGNNAAGTPVNYATTASALSNADWTDLTDGGQTTLHRHSHTPWRTTTGQSGAYADGTTTNTILVPDGVGTSTIAAARLVAGATVRVRFSGSVDDLDSAGPQTLNFYVTDGNHTSYWSAAAMTLGTAESKTFFCDTDIVIVATGGAGTVRGHGHTQYDAGSLGPTITAATIDTTDDWPVTIEFAASAWCYCDLNSFVVEVLD